MIHLEDPAVQAALIGGVCSLIATVIAAICAALIGQKLARIQRLKEQLLLAMDDVEFLLHCEEVHCSNVDGKLDVTKKLEIRKKAREQGHTWSGLFTPGRAAERRLYLK